MGVNFHRAVELKSNIELDLSGKEEDNRFDRYDKFILLRGDGLDNDSDASVLLNGDAGRLEVINDIVNGFKKEIKGLSSLDPDVKIVVDHSYQLKIQDSRGQAIQPEKEWWVRQNYFKELVLLLNRVSRHCNHSLLHMLTFHLGTPLPDSPLDWKKYYKPFQLPGPEEPLYQSIGWFDRLFPWKARAIEAENNELKNDYRCQQVAWQRQIDHHEYQQRQYWNNRLANADNALEFLKRTLNYIDWPHPLVMQVSLDHDLDAICLDMQLPEPDELPSIEFEVSEKDFSLTPKYLNAAEKQEQYIHYTYGIGLRLMGEIFRAIPVKKVVLFSYEKSNQNTMYTKNECLYSVEVSRQQWLSLDFSQFETLAPADLMTSFKLQRHTSRTDIFEQLKPFIEEDK